MSLARPLCLYYNLARHLICESVRQWSVSENAYHGLCTLLSVDKRLNLFSSTGLLCDEEIITKVLGEVRANSHLYGASYYGDR